MPFACATARSSAIQGKVHQAASVALVEFVRIKKVNSQASVTVQQAAKAPKEVRASSSRIPEQATLDSTQIVMADAGTTDPSASSWNARFFSSFEPWFTCADRRDGGVGRVCRTPQERSG